MLRTVFSPCLVALHLVTIAVLVSFTFLGRWQLGVFEDSGRPRVVKDPAPVAVGTLATPGRHITADAVSRRVTAWGGFDAARQLLVPERDNGFWLLTPLDLGDGTAIPVVRGWVAAPGDPAVAAVPEGEITVEGRLRPSEQVDDMRRASRVLEPGQIRSISTAELINVWRGVRLRDGYVVATALTPTPAVVPQAVRVAPPTEAGGLTWRNLAYAAQWWIFGAFAVFMWFHFVRDALRGRRKPAESPEAPAPDTVALSESKPR